MIAVSILRPWLRGYVTAIDDGRRFAYLFRRAWRRLRRVEQAFLKTALRETRIELRDEWHEPSGAVWRPGVTGQCEICIPDNGDAPRVKAIRFHSPHVARMSAADVTACLLHELGHVLQMIDGRTAEWRTSTGRDRLEQEADHFAVTRLGRSPWPTEALCLWLKKEREPIRTVNDAE